MNAIALLEDLTRQGFRLEHRGDKLAVVPGSKVTPELRALLLHHKADILAALAQVVTPASQDQSRAAPMDACSPWPATLPGLGTRTMGAFTVCLACGNGTLARFGGVPVCLRCARAMPGPPDPKGAREFLDLLLSAWAGMDESRWTRTEASALFDAIAGVWQAWPHVADGWFTEWRAAHAEARLC